LLVVALVKRGVGEGDGKRVELFAGEALGQRGNQRRVQAAAEIGADRNVRNQAETRGVSEELAKLVQAGGVGGSAGGLELWSRK
jgi:hypothetical protein